MHPCEHHGDIVVVLGRREREGTLEHGGDAAKAS